MAEILALRGVWLPRQVFLPAYGDQELVVYLASLGARKPGVAVLPVFTSAPVCFRSGKVVFVSTGLILTAGDERELNDAIRSARVEVQTRDLPSCAMMAPRAPAGFTDVRRRLAEQVAKYQNATAPRLRRRDPAPR